MKENFLLCKRLSELSTELVTISDWPAKQLELCAESGVFRWFVSKAFGGSEYCPQEIVSGYIELASACLTTAFVITQRSAACKRIGLTENEFIKSELLPKLAAGEIFATVGISHLTTSRRHLGRPVLTAEKRNGAWVLNGFSPWVTGGSNADFMVIGAQLEQGDQILLAVNATLPGINFHEPYETIALAASQTGKVEFNNVHVAEEYLLSGPDANVLKAGAAASTGGLQTSALAIGLGKAAVQFAHEQSLNRENLTPNVHALQSELGQLQTNILQLAKGEVVCSPDDLRTNANSFVLRATQSALIAAKGAGFVKGHVAGRWCKEALFFLVWSCPQVVSDANLCEFAGIAEWDQR